VDHVWLKLLQTADEAWACKVEFETRVDDEGDTKGANYGMAGVLANTGFGAEDHGFMAFVVEVLEKAGEGAGDAVDFGEEVFGDDGYAKFGSLEIARVGLDEVVDSA